MPDPIVLYNPLPKALAHYEAETETVLRAAGHAVQTIHAETEGLSGVAKLRGLLIHVVNARRVGRGNVTIVLWPVLGWLELLLWDYRRGATVVIVHDPKPLRQQVGLGRRSARLGRLTRRVLVGAHSAEAVADIRSAVGDVAILDVPHPVLPAATPAEPQSERPAVSPVVRVLGQYKPARDLELLEAFACDPRTDGWQLEVRGRGWPAIPGWDVEDRFLSELEMDQLLSTADAVIVPYTHYYQSGVAVRAIEMRSGVVGAPTGFLREMLGDNYPGLVQGDSVAAWIDAVERVRSSGSPSDPFPHIAEAWRTSLSGSGIAS